MATAASAALLLSNNKKIVWFRQVNPNPCNEDEEKEWERYSDFENEFIEEAYQQRKNKVQLNDCLISFKYNLQFDKQDRKIQTTVKRGEIDVSNYVREERFCYPERAVNSFADGAKPWDHAFYGAWRRKNLPIDCSAIAELAAQGILQEGILLNQEFDAQRMADQLRNCTNDDLELSACAARLYSAETFLYKLVNSILRHEDMSKVDTLGPFFHLLYKHVQKTQDRQEQIVYRGTTLTDEMIEEYRQAVGTLIRWLAFTSTSKDRRIAEMYGGNTLFIITLQGMFLFDARCDISALSHYPNEQEVLLTASYRFRVDQVDRDTSSGKYLIYMKDVNL